MNETRSTTAIVLVAGRGSRLSAVNANRPKCLVSVNGLSILKRLVTALEDNAVERAVLVVGYDHEAIEDSFRQNAPRLPVRFALNLDYLTSGTARSSLIGLEVADPTDDVLVIEGDVLFEPAILTATMSRCAAAATALARWRPEHSGSCAVLDERRVVSWIHQTRRPVGFDPGQHHKTVNLTWLSREAWTMGLLPALEETLREDGQRAPVEYAFHRLVTKGSHPVAGIVVDPCKWWEVDTPEDLQIARELFP